MTLTTLLLAYVPVALLFVLAARVAGGRRLTRAAAAVAAAEALALTLLAALWFGSLGAGGWLLVFGLLGILAAGGERAARAALLGLPAGPEFPGFLVGLAKYLAAGAFLAWRLG